MSTSSSSSRRAGSSAFDLLRSLVPLTVLILVMVWLYSPEDVDPVREVDPRSTLAYAASVVDFPVLAAADLPSGWRSTSARAESLAEGAPLVVSVGYVTPAEEFAQVVQGASPALLADVLGPGYVEEDSAAGGWQALRTDDGEAALVRPEGSSTVVVTGSADADELLVLAESLGPVPVP